MGGDCISSSTGGEASGDISSSLGLGGGTDDDDDDEGVEALGDEAGDDFISFMAGAALGALVGSRADDTAPAMARKTRARTTAWRAMMDNIC
ncbi:hypothetical protein Scep_018018 [Stephania cephalantha]|uniref:Uncharacterized protein n=1 Tax=Stephania cephalantha TaxID=152367 RepID=A0AAP0IRK0_9MAGN